jgi:hypothetical protein
MIRTDDHGWGHNTAAAAGIAPGGVRVAQHRAARRAVLRGGAGAGTCAMELLRLFVYFSLIDL